VKSNGFVSVNLDFQHGASDTSFIDSAQHLSGHVSARRKLGAIIEDARQRTRRRRIALGLVGATIAVVAVTALPVFDEGPGGLTVGQSQSQSASSNPSCFGTSGVAGEGDGSKRTAIVSSSCGMISAEDLKTNVTSTADWYAAHSPKMTVDGLRMGCELSRTDARMYLQMLGQTFSFETLRDFRAACKG